MPVSKACTCVSWSVNFGASRWIGDRVEVATGPFWSPGSPITFMMRPSVASPTGTVMPCPVSRTSSPRTRPSVVSMAIVRTVFSPRCCATSSTRFQGWSLIAALVTVRALKIGGNLPSGNSTSTTAPMTCMMRPLLGMRNLSLQCFGARDDLHQLGGDGGLAGAVHRQGEAVDHLAGVPSRVVHRGHPGAQLAGIRFEQGLQQPSLDVAGQQACQQLGTRRLVDVLDRCGVLGGRLHGEQAHHGGNLGDRGLEAAVEQIDGVGLVRSEARRDALGHLAGDLGRADAEHARALGQRCDPPPAVIVESLAADQHQLHLAILMLAEESLALAQEVRVEAAAEAAIAGEHHEVDATLLAPSQEWMRLLGEPGDDGREHLRELRSVGPRLLGGLLRAAQARSGDHLHGLGDLLRRADRADPLAEVLQAGHQAAKRISNSLSAPSSFATTSSLSSFLSRMAASTSGCFASRKE